MKTWQKIAIFAMIMAICVAIGFFTGRKISTIKTVTVTEYVELPPIHDSVTCFVPYEVVKPCDTLNIIKQCIKDGKFAEMWPKREIRDSIIITKADTTAIMADWATIRNYKDTLFNSDSVGTCIYEARVQYNEMKMLGYTYTPIQKEVKTIEQKVRTFSPFIGVGISIQPTVEAEFGGFIDEKWGASISGRYNLKPVDNQFLSKYDFSLKVIRKF